MNQSRHQNYGNNHLNVTQENSVAMVSVLKGFC